MMKRVAEYTSGVWQTSAAVLLPRDSNAVCLLVICAENICTKSLFKNVPSSAMDVNNINPFLRNAQNLAA